MEKTEKTNIYIDMANLYAECRRKDIVLNFESMFNWLKDKYKSDHIYIFTGYLEKYVNHYYANEAIGYKYVFKEAVFNIDENKIKANCDVDIAIHGTLDTIENNLKKALLISSDGDFLSLLKFWISREVKVAILSPADPNKCSYLLKKDNIPITYLKQVIDRFTNEKALDEDETS